MVINFQDFCYRKKNKLTFSRKRLNLTEILYQLQWKLS